MRLTFMSNDSINLKSILAKYQKSLVGWDEKLILKTLGFLLNPKETKTRALIQKK